MGFEKKSPWLIHYDGSSCNGCDIEVLACLTPLYDVERFGIVNTGDPKHADIFLVTGGVNAQNLPVVRQIYEQMPEPKVVVAVGTCACTGGVFRECYNMHGQSHPRGCVCTGLCGPAGIYYRRRGEGPFGAGRKTQETEGLRKPWGAGRTIEGV